MESAAASFEFDLESLWTETLSAVTPDVTSPVQREWLASTRPVGYSDDTVILATPHAFAREWLSTRCGDQLQEALSEAAGRQLTLMITVQPRPEPVHAVDDTVAAPAPDTDTADEQAGGEQTGGEQTGGEQTGDTGTSNTGTPDTGTAGTDTAPHGDTSPGAEKASPTTDTPLDAPGRPPGPTIVVPEQQSNGSRTATTAGTTEGQLNPKYVFENFVIGASNRFARAAARAVAEAPAKSYNPLFIYGGAGLGKTHLLHAIGHYVLEWYPRLTVRYVATEQFLNHFIDSVQNGRMTEFQHTYRQADVLLIDDIQFIESKDRTQEEFFHTFNALHNAEKQIVITSDRPPREMVALEDRLRSRFQWGLMTDVQPPDLETRIAILRKKSEADSLGVPDEVLELIASRVQSNIRELEGALIRVTAFASLQQAPPDLRMSERVLKDLFPDDRTQEVGVHLIMEEVADYFDVTVEDFESKSRRRQLTTGRQIAMYLVREMTEMSLPEIGRAFGGRDHTTVIHAKDKIAKLMQDRQTIYDQVIELTSRIKARARAPR